MITLFSLIKVCTASRPAASSQSLRVAKAIAAHRTRMVACVRLQHYFRARFKFSTISRPAAVMGVTALRDGDELKFRDYERFGGTGITQRQRQVLLIPTRSR